ncbi:MAG: adenylosuccinate lyase, partial [Patescibacteria group bacterium]
MHLDVISPLDGRYREVAEKLAGAASELGLIRYRLLVECTYLLFLAKEAQVPLTLTPPERKFLMRLPIVAQKDAAVVQAIEKEGYKNIPATRHDVKAVEYFLREKFKGTSLEKKMQWIHFGLTSEDVNNIAYALMLRECTYVTANSLRKLVGILEILARRYAPVAMLARTHGQPASPTTFGKEIRVFAERVHYQLGKLLATVLLAKLNGASGNYNALVTSFPRVNWVAFSKKFIGGFNQPGDTIRLECNAYTTQIEPHDSYAELFQVIARINTILLDFTQDMWRYISDGWVVQRIKKGEVGSSTMPHKVNPIHFENAEGNLGLANALFTFFAAKLPISRLQRDLSDSTVERNFGVAYAHTLVAYEAIRKGLAVIAPQKDVMERELAKHPEVLAEAIQTILRREGVP